MASSNSQPSASNSTSTQRSKESRTGRSNQRYNPSGERLVAGVVPVTQDRTKVMLIKSLFREHWVLPKGGWEVDETVEEASVREAWEEGGIDINIEHDLGTIEDKRKPKASKHDPEKQSPRSVLYMFEAVVVSEHDDWPEALKRDRKWVTYSEAMSELKGRPELQEALTRSNLDKTL